MTGHTSRSWSDKGGRFTADTDEGPPSRWATADPRDGVAYMWCNGHEYDPSRVETDYFDQAAEPNWFDPFAWWGALLDAVFGPDDPHADYAASHPGPPTMIGPCDIGVRDHAAGEDDAAGAER